MERRENRTAEKIKCHSIGDGPGLIILAKVLQGVKVVNFLQHLLGELLVEALHLILKKEPFGWGTPFRLMVQDILFISM